MKWKLLILAALVTAAVVLISGNLFEISSGRQEGSNEIVPVDIPTASPTTADVTPETPSEKPAAWDPWANSDGSFEELKLARVPSANELLTPTFTKEEIEKIDREPHEGNGRTLMIMAFERTERSTKNVEFLINQVVGGRRAKDIDFIFVDTSKEGPYKCFPQLPNVLYVHRERVGFDICSYKVGLAIAPPGRYKYRGRQGRYHLSMGQFVLRRDSRFLVHFWNQPYPSFTGVHFYLDPFKLFLVSLTVYTCFHRLIPCVYGSRKTSVLAVALWLVRL